MNSPKHQSHLSRLRAALAPLQEEKRWGPLAHLMLATRENELFAPEHPSFNAWMTWVVAFSGMSKARVWRYDAAGRYYESVRDQGACALPALKAVPASVSAEGIEIMSWIVKVLPAEQADELIEKALTGKIAVRKLKDIWTTCRPKGYDGKGSHLRSGDAARLAIRKWQTRTESRALRWLMANLEWTGVAGGFVQFLRDVCDTSGHRSIDAIAVVRPPKSDSLAIHAIYICDQDTSEEGDVSEAYRLPKGETLADYRWVVARPGARLDIDDDVGVIDVMASSDNVIKRATQRAGKGLDSFSQSLVYQALRAS